MGDVPSEVRGQAVAVHYAEIGLKGGNRHQFERRLGDRLRQALEHAGLKPAVQFREQRYWIDTADEPHTQAVLEAVTRVPGVAHAAVVRFTAPEMGAIQAAAVDLLAQAPAGTFKLESRRSDKTFPLTSLDISRQVAGHLVATTGRVANVRQPDITVRVHVSRKQAWVSAHRVPGPGGLPVGSAVRMLAFLSGGLDSPVAVWHMLRRGAPITAVHFHNRTLQGRAVLEKLEDLCAVLARVGGSLPLKVVPFEACQRAIVAAVPAPFRMLVYRRAMFRIASRIARQERALGYVTGDSLGQVASQTAENIHTIQAVADLPVYMPLCGSDKTEIVDRARQIGTYDISIRPHEDCCSFLIAERPATKSTPAQLDELEAGLDWDALVEEALAGLTTATPRS